MVKNKICVLLLKTHCSIVLKGAFMCFSQKGKVQPVARQGAVLKEVHNHKVWLFPKPRVQWFFLGSCFWNPRGTAISKYRVLEETQLSWVVLYNWMSNWAHNCFWLQVLPVKNSQTVSDTEGSSDCCRKGDCLAWTSKGRASSLL